MPAIDGAEGLRRSLGRRALLIISAAALAGSMLGLFAAHERLLAGIELALVFSCLLFSATTLGALLVLRNIPFQTLATASTAYYAAYLCAGAAIAAASPGHALHLFIYLIWFFPLLAVNKLVNAPVTGRTFAKILRAVPFLLVLCLAGRLLHGLNAYEWNLLGAYCLGYLGFGSALDIVTRYREEYLVERERDESSKAESELLESISDCFISVGDRLRLEYLNEAACTEFGVDRETAVAQTIADAAPAFLSEQMSSRLRVASQALSASAFEAPNLREDAWYELRCFPRATGMSIFFRNITASIVARRKLEEAQERIEQLAFYDPLTNLPNRYLLRERLAAAIATSARDGESGALLLVNLDDFRTPNDTLGHDLGDALLRQAALRLRECVGDTGTVARLGGDEFVVLLEGLSDDRDGAAAAAREIGERVRMAFRSPYELGNLEYRGSVTVGARLFAGPHSTVDELLSQVDLAMYRAKDQGRNTLCFFDPSMQTLVAARASLQADLRRAMQNHEFELYYQPVVDGRGRVLGAEALLRWEHPVRGMVPPSEFIPLAEESGLIAELGRWALETACAQLAKWALSVQTRGLTLAVNVSLRELLDSNFASVVLSVLQTSGADPRRLRLEITESCAMTNADDTIAKMILLKDHFVGFSIDDFGTGYSSLAHLRRLPLDILKVDRSFVNDVLTDPRNASIVRTIIALGRNLGLFVIAEGVETEEQRQFLEAEGCDGYQGFLFSPALRAPLFEAFVAARLAAPDARDAR